MREVAIGAVAAFVVALITITFFGPAEPPPPPPAPVRKVDRRFERLERLRISPPGDGPDFQKIKRGSQLEPTLRDPAMRDPALRERMRRPRGDAGTP